MRGYLLVSHGLYAQEFKESLKMIAGDVSNVHTACLSPDDGPESFGAKLTALETTLNQYDEVLVFSDLFGGSPGNTTFQKYVTNEKYNFISGMNFPMVLTAILTPTADIEQLITSGKEGIIDVKAFSKTMLDDDE